MGRATTKTPAKKATKRSNARSRSTAGSGATSLDRIVQAIGSRVTVGDDRPDRKMIMGIALMTNLKSFNTTLLNIKKKKGLIQYDKNSVWLTEAGREYLGEDALAAPADNKAMQAKIRSEMIKGQKPRQIFDLLLNGEWWTKDEIAEEMGIPNNKSLGTYISSLSKVYERDGASIRLLDMAFPFGRPGE